MKTGVGFTGYQPVPRPEGGVVFPSPANLRAAVNYRSQIVKS